MLNQKAGMGFIIAPLVIKRLLYLILITSSAFIIQDYLGSSQKYWLVWSACILGLITHGDSFKRRITVILVAGLIAAFSAFLSACLAFYPFILAVFLFMLTISCVAVSLRYSEYFFVAFVINLFAIMSGELPAPVLIIANRFLIITFGMGIALFFQVLFYPYFVRNELQSFVVITLRNLKKVNEEIFSCFIDAEYPDNIYLYERRLHLQKNRYMQSIRRLREIISLASRKMDESESGYYAFLLGRLDLLYDNMLDYSQLRRRVTDHATFSVCLQELSAVSNEIGRVIEGMMMRVMNRNYHLDTDALVRHIKRLEENYTNVLQVAAREPLVFLLFINSLKCFCNAIDAYLKRVLPEASSYS
jgi:uncharacterized membrane protein YgaE (UPF0421/DUF939 family)